MIAAAQHVEKIKDTFEMTQQEAEFFINEQFSGCELVLDTHRLALMNAMLHGLKSNILLGDSLSNLGKEMMNMDVILSNPPFGTKKGGNAPPGMT